jgi:hypothetical protein
MANESKTDILESIAEKLTEARGLLQSGHTALEGRVKVNEALFLLNNFLGENKNENLF